MTPRPRASSGTSLSAGTAQGFVTKLAGRDGHEVWTRMAWASMNLGIAGVVTASTGDVFIGGLFAGDLFSDQAPSMAPNKLPGASGNPASMLRAIAP